MPRDDWAKNKSRDIGRRALASGSYERAAIQVSRSKKKRDRKHGRSHESRLAREAESLVFWFGKYRGRTVGDVMRTDRPYLFWLANQEWQCAGRMKDLIDHLKSIVGAEFGLHRDK